MTHPISTVVPLQAYASQRAAAPEGAPVPPEAVVPTPASEPAAPSPARKPIALSVDRNASGVFVYTLTDSASGRVLAVIPRSAVAPASQAGGEGVDLQA